MNPGNNEEIRVGIPVDTTQIDAANKKLGELEKNARKIEVVQRSANSMRQITERLERQAAGFGLTGNDRAIAMARMSLDKLKSDEALYARGQKALDGMIERQKTLASQTELTTKANESFFGSFLKAQIVVDALHGIGSAVKNITVEMAKYAAGTQLYIVAARAVATANGDWGASADMLMSKMRGMGITTRDSARAVSQSITGGMGTSHLTQLARMAQDVAVMAPESTSSDVLTRMLYAIQSAQPEMLRTVGVNVNFEKAYSTFASANKRTVESLTENEKAQIRLANVLDRGRRWAGLYEESLGFVGKQIQQLDRYMKEAANAVGEKFLPVLSLFVKGMIEASKVAQAHPYATAQGITVLGAAGAGAMAGGMIGGPKGALIGGAGAGAATKIGMDAYGIYASGKYVLDVMSGKVGANVPESVLSASGGIEPGQWGSAAGAAMARTFSFTLSSSAFQLAYGLYSKNKDIKAEIPRSPVLKNVQKSMAGVPDQVVADQAALQAKMESDAAKRKDNAAKVERERFSLLAQIVQVQQQDFVGLAKINAEHEEHLRRLKQEKLDVAELIGLTGQLRQAKLQAFVDDNRKRVQNFRMEGTGITAGTTASALPSSLDMGINDFLGIATYEKFLASQKPVDLMDMMGASAQAAMEEHDLATRAAQKSADQQLQAYESMYNRLRSGFESSFDSIIRSGANAASILRNLFLSALLTPIKQAASAMFANIFMPIAMGGRGGGGGGFSAAGAMSSGLGMAGMIGPGGTAPFVGGGGASGIGSLGSIGGIGAMSGAKMGAFSAAGIGSLAVAGGGLGVFGAFKAGQSGNKALKYSAPAIGAVAGMTAMGGLMAMFPSLVAMGPVGLIAAGAIGAVIGMIGMFKKTAEQKARDKIKAYYGIDISDKGILTQIVGLAKQSYGGNLDVAVRAREIRDLIELYAMSTGQRLNAADNRPMGVNLSQMGGSFYQTGSYSNGVGYSYGGSIAPIAGLSKFTTPTAAPIVLDSEGTKEFWSDVMATGIVQNPRAVQRASLSAQSQNYGRTSAAVNLTDPLGATI